MSSANVARHKLRSGLTTLGIVLGIGAVIGTVALGASFERGFTDAFDGIFDPDGMVIQPGEIRGGVQSSIDTVPLAIFTERDVAAVGALDGVARAYGMQYLQLDTADGMRFGDRSFPNPVAYASDPGFVGPRGYRPVATGSGIEGAGEVVVPHEVAEDLAALANRTGSDALGLEVAFRTAAGRAFAAEVVGVLRPSPPGSATFVYVGREPWMTKARPEVGGGANVTVHDTLVVLAEEGRGAESVTPSVLAYLDGASDAKRFLDRDAPRLGFVVITQREITRFIEQQIGQFGAFISSIGLISLLVGGIGIANTMLVSVTERTREIGVMKATGARRRDVLQLFLTEAALLCTVGALLGAAFGWALGFGLTQYGFFAGEDLPLVFEPRWVAFALAAGVAAGLLSGIYPAWRAARMNPVEALRYE